MPAGVRVQQLTPVGRSSSNQGTTIVRLMSPATSTIRSGTGQQQIIQLNTNKQQQPLVIKAITTPSSNRQQQQQQQPILLAANTQHKTFLPQNQQQVLVFNQGQQPKFTLQMTNIDQSNSNNVEQKTTTIPQLDGCYHLDTSSQDKFIPQIDGSVDDPVKNFNIEKK